MFLFIFVMLLINSRVFAQNIDTGFITYSQYTGTGCTGEIISTQSDQLGLCYNTVDFQFSYEIVASQGSTSQSGSTMLLNYTGVGCTGTPTQTTQITWSSSCGSSSDFDSKFGQFSFSNSPSCDTFSGLNGRGYVSLSDCTSQSVENLAYCFTIKTGECYYTDKMYCYGNGQTAGCNQLYACNTDVDTMYSVYE